MSSRAQHELLPYGSYFNFNIILEPYLINFHSIPFQKTNTKCILSILKKKTKAPAKQNVSVWSFSRLNKKRQLNRDIPELIALVLLEPSFSNWSTLLYLSSLPRTGLWKNTITLCQGCTVIAARAPPEKKREKKKTFGDKVSSYPFPPP